MKHNLVNFTRGSQLLGHFGFMFAAGLKGPLIVTILVRGQRSGPAGPPRQSRDRPGHDEA